MIPHGRRFLVCVCVFGWSIGFYIVKVHIYTLKVVMVLAVDTLVVVVVVVVVKLVVVLWFLMVIIILCAFPKESM